MKYRELRLNPILPDETGTIRVKVDGGPRHVFVINVPAGVGVDSVIRAAGKLKEELAAIGIPAVGVVVEDGFSFALCEVEEVGHDAYSRAETHHLGPWVETGSGSWSRYWNGDESHGAANAIGSSWWATSPTADCEGSGEVGGGVDDAKRAADAWLKELRENYK